MNSQDVRLEMKAFMQDFDLRSLDSWIAFFNFLPRFPILFVFDCCSCCYLIRVQLKFRNPLFSLFLTIVMATITDNLFSLVEGRQYALFYDDRLLPIVIGVWALFNFSPFDITYKIADMCSLLIAIFRGYVSARDLTKAVDILSKRYTSWIFVVIFSVLFVASKYMIRSLFGKIMKQDVRSFGPIIFELACGAVFYYACTEMGQLCRQLCFEREKARLAVIVLLSMASFIRVCVSDKYYSAVWDKVEGLGALVIPYYGKTWIPDLQYR